MWQNCAHGCWLVVVSTALSMWQCDSSRHTTSPPTNLWKSPVRASIYWTIETPLPAVILCEYVGIVINITEYVCFSPFRYSIVNSYHNLLPTAITWNGVTAHACRQTTEPNNIWKYSSGLTRCFYLTAIQKITTMALLWSSLLIVCFFSIFLFFCSFWQTTLANINFMLKNEFFLVTVWGRSTIITTQIWFIFTRRPFGRRLVSYTQMISLSECLTKPNTTDINFSH